MYFSLVAELRYRPATYNKRRNYLLIGSRFAGIVA